MIIESMLPTTQPNTKQYNRANLVVIDNSSDTHANENNDEEYEANIHMTSIGKPPEYGGSR